MTLIEIMERIQAQYPDVGIPECIREMSTAQSEFAAATNCLVGPLNLESGDFSSGTYEIDKDIVKEVKNAVFTDANGVALDIEGKVGVSDHLLTIYNLDGTIMTTFPSAATYLKIQCVLIPDYLDVDEVSDLNDEPILDRRFHMALVWGPMITLSLLRGRPDLAKTAQTELRKLIIEGKKYANQQSDALIDSSHGPFVLLRDFDYSGGTATTS